MKRGGEPLEGGRHPGPRIQGRKNLSLSLARELSCGSLSDCRKEDQGPRKGLAPNQITTTEVESGRGRLNRRDQ